MSRCARKFSKAGKKKLRKTERLVLADSCLLKPPIIAHGMTAIGDSGNSSNAILDPPEQAKRATNSAGLQLQSK